MGRPRVVHIGSGHPVRHIRIHLKECKSLAEAGYDVRFIAVHDAEETIDGVRIVPMRPPHGRFDRICIWPWKALRAAFRNRGHVYHLHNAGLIPMGLLLRITGAIVIYDMHENTPKWLLTAGWLPPGVRPTVSRLYSLVERMMLMGMPVVFAETSYVGDYPWVKQGAVVLNMPDVDSLPETSKDKFERPTLAYFGVVEEGRGSFVTLEAMRILSERGIIVNWACIGPMTEEHRSRILELAARYNLVDQVHLYGRVTPDEGWRLMAKCHVGLALLEPWPNYVESYPTKIFEYMGLGLPVITSDFKLYRSVVDRCGCGFCVDPLNAEYIASTIQRILDDHELARSMGARGVDAVREMYRWRNESTKLVAFYNALLSNRTLDSEVRIER